MDHFHYQDGQLFAERVNMDELAAAVGTPAFVYSRQTFEDHYRRLADAFAPLNPLICYSVKSCGNIHILRHLADLGSGMDVVSGGELYRAQQAGVDPAKIVYAGVGKTDPEIREALEAGIAYFNIESEAEFENIARIAREMNRQAHAALRINPDVDPKTAHAKTTTGKKESKFGVDIDRARRFFHRYGRDAHLRLTALHLHIGSPVYQVQPYEQAIDKALSLVDELREQGCTIDALDIGGGFGANYTDAQTPDYAEYADRIVPLLKPFVEAGGRVMLEPGRTIAGNAGVLLMRVQYVKMGGRKKFIIVDSGMHHLLRPTLYDAFHFIWPTNVAPDHVPSARQQEMSNPGLEPVDVVGPICETGDYLALDRPLPPVARGDLLAAFSAGAYGIVMASHYNAMPHPPEVLVQDDHWSLIRRRETYEDLVAAEQLEHTRTPEPRATVESVDADQTGVQASA